MPQVEKRTWREARGSDWSSTLYEGLYFSIGGYYVLVSKLSHGLRVLPVNLTKQQFQESEGLVVVVPEPFIKEVKVALEADLNFQQQLGEYERAMSSAS